MSPRAANRFCSDLVLKNIGFPAPDELTGPLNLGNPREFSIIELAETVITLTNSKSEMIFAPLPADDPKQRCPDITLAKDKLG